MALILLTNRHAERQFLSSGGYHFWRLWEDVLKHKWREHWWCGVQLWRRGQYLLYVIPWVMWSTAPCDQLVDHMCDPLVDHMIHHSGSCDPLWQIMWPQVLATLLICSLQWQPDQGKWTPAKEPCGLTYKLKCGHSNKCHIYSTTRVTIYDSWKTAIHISVVLVQSSEFSLVFN